MHQLTQVDGPRIEHGVLTPGHALRKGMHAASGVTHGWPHVILMSLHSHPIKLPS